MTRHDLEEPLKCLLPLRNDFIAEPVGEYLERRRKVRSDTVLGVWNEEKRHLSWKLGNRYPRAFLLEDIAEGLEIRVSTAHDGLLKFEGWDVCLFEC